ncbi:MAG: hypothetical protein CSB47_00160 [Proteobacteria bacterium]|nr:MAG: hypothetical protein CSB47_00160 [Pseudomonadota bacterium]
MDRILFPIGFDNYKKCINPDLSNRGLPIRYFKVRSFGSIQIPLLPHIHTRNSIVLSRKQKRINTAVLSVVAILITVSLLDPPEKEHTIFTLSENTYTLNNGVFTSTLPVNEDDLINTDILVISPPIEEHGVPYRYLGEHLARILFIHPSEKTLTYISDYESYDTHQTLLLLPLKYYLDNKPSYQNKLNSCSYALRISEIHVFGGVVTVKAKIVGDDNKTNTIHILYDTTFDNGLIYRKTMNKRGLAISD